MAKLRNIISGYTTKTLADFNLATKESEELAYSRMQVCKGCKIFNSHTSTCSSSKGGCGCNMKVKVYCKDCNCPKNKW